MFDRVGEKIKILAKVLCWGGVVISCAIGLMILITGGSDTTLSYAGRQIARGSGWLTGSLFVILGCLSSWICSLFVFAVGELVEKTQQNNAYLSAIAQSLVKPQEKAAEANHTYVPSNSSFTLSSPHR